MIAQFPDFTPITIHAKNDIQSFVSQFEPYSDFNFTSMFAWGDHTKSGVSLLHGNLVMRLPDYTSDAVVYSVLGDAKAEQTIKDLRAVTSQIDLVPEIFAKQLVDAGDITEAPGDFDYVYDIAELSALPGGRYKKIRNKVHSVEKQYGPRISVTFSSKPDVYALCGLFEEWARAAGREQDEVQRERAAIYKTLVAAADIELVVAELFIDGQICGFSINEVLDNGYAICHFEKVLKKHPHLSSYFVREIACELHRRGCVKVNWEQDLGIEGLRQVKMNYHPCKLLKKYSVIL